MPSWPSDLPQDWFNDSGPKYAPDDNTIRSPVSGPAKLRRRYTAQTEQVTVSRQLQESDLAKLENFVKNTLGEVKQFVWRDFCTGRPANFRFKAGWSSVQKTWFGEDLWDVTLALEKMP